jgi:hypothetical protein
MDNVIGPDTLRFALSFASKIADLFRWAMLDLPPNCAPVLLPVTTCASTLDEDAKKW